jgi:hypothetical protein
MDALSLIFLDGWLAWTTWGGFSLEWTPYQSGYGFEARTWTNNMSATTFPHPTNSHTRYSSPLLPVRLHAIQLLKLHLLQHPTINSNPRLRLAYHRVMGHTPTMLATVEAQRLVAPHVSLYSIVAFDVDFSWFVVRPESAVSPADGAEAFEGGLAERWEGDADRFAVAGYAH